ncbi:MAG: hypothetical protein PHW04_15415 [Candidatus Wallbacteria bacterium]|nr:hypothetical protein [Candidatus Wallbacteria bacterium]
MHNKKRWKSGAVILICLFVGGYCLAADELDDLLGGGGAAGSTAPVTGEVTPAVPPASPSGTGEVPSAAPATPPSAPAAPATPSNAPAGPAAPAAEQPKAPGAADEELGVPGEEAAPGAEGAEAATGEEAPALPDIGDSSKKPEDTEDYLVDNNRVKYFNDDPAEDGGILNPFETLIKPPKPPKIEATVARGQEAPKPLRLRLIGIVVNGDVKIALIENMDKNEQYELSEGEKTPDFSVVEIGEDKVTIFAYGLNMRRTITVAD